ncbi:hypothetical protein [Aminivibrio sp.]|uniref:hypothetical protein n=1 Tax=Aminivibrio sp. TaxID=1872489 RepID=UPI00345E7B11
MVNTLPVEERDTTRATRSFEGDLRKHRDPLPSLLGVLGPGQRMWNCEVPKGKNALIGVSSRNYDIILQQARIPTETSATFLYKVDEISQRE